MSGETGVERKHFYFSVFGEIESGFETLRSQMDSGAVQEVSIVKSLL